MIDSTQQVTVTRSGLNILTEGDTPNQLFTFGKIVLLRKKHCIVLVSVGPQAGKKIDMPLVYPAQIEGTTYHVDVPQEIEDTSPAEPKRVKTSLEGGVTKIQRCRELYAANPQFTREQMIALFISEAKCTPQGAVTYFLTCKK